MELGLLCLCCACHSSQLVEHAKIILDCHCGESLSLTTDLYAFFCLNCLVEPVAPSPTSHLATCEFINDHHFPVLTDDVLLILVKERVGF